MKNQKMTYSLLSLAIFMVGVMPTVTVARPEKEEKKEPNSFLIGAVAGGLAAAGACLLGNLWKTSDEDLMRNADHACQDADRYQVIARRVIDVEYHNGVENALEEVTRLVITSTDYSMRRYNQEIQAVISRLNSCNEALLKRINSGECCHKYSAMQSAVDSLNARRSFLQPYSNFLTQHKDYFGLLKLKNKLNQKYAREFAASYYYTTNFNYFLSEVRVAAMNSRTFDAYPYIAYVENLARDRRDIAAYINKVSYQPYSRLLQLSRDVSGWLDTIHGQALADPSYAQALRDREYNRLQEERLRLERERVLLAQQQLAVPRVRVHYHQGFRNPTVHAKLVIK